MTCSRIAYASLDLQDEVLSDSQKLEFLPRFVTGEVYEVIERIKGWREKLCRLL